MNMLARAISIASEAHENQVDKGGKAYILHPLRVMNSLKTTDEELMQIAVLHDVVEDTTWTVPDLIELGFSLRVMGAIRLLTHKPEDSYEDYVTKVSTNKDAARVKLADLEDNSDITRLNTLSVKELERLEKYHRAYVFLKESLNG